MFCITYEKLHILNKKRRAFYEEAPTTETILILLLFFAYDDLWPIIFEVSHVEEGGT